MNHHSVKFVLMVILWWMISASAMAAELRSWVQCPGGLSSTVSSKHLWQVVGESVIGVSTGPSKKENLGFLAGLDVKDSTPPMTPVVTDDGDFTGSASELHAQWITEDQESGLADCQYAIGTTPGGTGVQSWTSVGNVTEFTKTGLNLANGTRYYFSVKAKNREGIWSKVGVSDGIVVDTKPPAILITSPVDGMTLEAQ